MKHKKSIARIILALLLVLCMCSSFLSIAPVEAQKEQETVEQEQSKGTEESTENASEDTKEESAKETKVEKNNNENSKKNTIAPLEGDSENPVENETQSEEKPFTMKVTFDGNDLKADSENNITDVWSGNSSKMMTIVISRNKTVTVDPDKQYVLCMKTSDVFYFNGIPEAKKITGAEEVAMVKNQAPIVNKSAGKSEALDGFSNYSGEIRIKLNNAVEKITIPDVGISYNLALLGFNGASEQTVSDPFQVEIDSVDSSLSLSQISENNKVNLQQVKVQSIKMKTGSLSGANWKSAMSTDYFNKAVLMLPVTLAKDGGHISYYFGTAGVESQVYKSMTIVVNCPYIEIDGVKHYLAVKTDDIALQENKKQDGEKNIKATGYKMENSAVYDAEKHTITYTFKNIYLGGHTPLLYTPEFTWPSDLTNELYDAESYKIQGVSFNVTEQKGYLGFNSTLNDKFTQSDSYSATFMPKQVDVKMASSNDSGKNVAKRYIYKGLTRENGNEGTLGFFDIHNDGTLDSSLLNVKYDFNTGTNDKATYYVTRVNLAVYGNTDGTDVSYVLSNGENTISGKKHYNNTSSFYCRVADLRQNSRADNNYYIKSISYKTYLEKGTSYHAETAHLNRNREADSGLFFGYLEGELGTQASATLEISAEDDQTSINSEGKTKISSTEVSTVSDQDYIGMSINGINGVNIEGANSKAISAGGSVTLNIRGIVSSEEYPMPSSGQVNGYHVLRDGIFYICLPEGISIAGKDQVKITSDGKKVESEGPTRITRVFDVNGVSAYWWAIPVNGLNTEGGKIINAAIELSTSESMAGLVWNFSNCIAIQAKDQSVSWASASSVTSIYNTTEELNKTEVIKNLSGYFEESGQKDKLGIIMFNKNGNARLNVARAEAKLDVATSLSTSEPKAEDQSAAISKKDSDIIYDVTVSCTEDGAAKDFYYYIPIVRKDSEIDASALVEKNEVGLELKKAVSITKIQNDDTDGEDLPFEIDYTTDPGLNSTSIQGQTVTWEKNYTHYSKVTAVRIKTKDNASLKQGESYQFSVSMNYDNSDNDFESQAGSAAAWRSFGRYTYTRNNATTINSYPSGSNSVRIRYVKDMTETPIELKLDTSATTNSVDGKQTLPTKFANEQKLTIKSVTPSNGTQLVPKNTEPGNLTGADANSKFKMVFNLNNSSSAMILPSVGAGWTIQKETQIFLQARVYFSKALTDVTTDRYVDIVLGNDDVDIKCRVKLQRTVAPASADGSGLALGEQFQVPKVATDCKISRDSAFTALYVIKNFVPGNYSDQLLKWKRKKEGKESNFPSGTTITMMEIDDDNKVTSYWYAAPTGSSINLKSFTRMSGTEKYSYNTSATNSTTLRYLFVVDFGQTETRPETGNYQLEFDANAKEGASAFNPVALNVMLGTTKNYTLTSTVEKEDTQNPTAGVTYKVDDADGNDSYSEGRSLSLVLTPTEGTTLPSDAKIVNGDETYTCNSNKNIIIPIGTIKDDTKQLKLTSKMFPDEKQTYSFNAKLMLSNSDHAETPDNGKKVASTIVSFSKAQKKSPALKVTGTRIADQNAWNNGQDINIQMENMKDRTVTVTAYSGLSGNSKVTDLMSSVSGIFTIQNGVGTYNSEQSQTGKLVLSSTAKSGTYRLVFEVKNASGEVLMTVPYYFIVK